MHSLTLKSLNRSGSASTGETRVARRSADFAVDGISLLSLLVNAGEEHGDFMGCFVNGFGDQNTKKQAQLVAASAPDTEEGRFLLYICPECGDLGCGAFAAKVRVDKDVFEWYDFAYENGYEPGLGLPSVGPFRFSRVQYLATLSEASAA